MRCKVKEGGADRGQTGGCVFHTYVCQHLAQKLALLWHHPGNANLTRSDNLTLHGSAVVSRSQLAPRVAAGGGNRQPAVVDNGGPQPRHGDAHGTIRSATSQAPRHHRAS